MDGNRLSVKAMRDITEQFYSNFCGIDISGLRQGIYFVCSSERDMELKGTGGKYTIYTFVKGDLCIVAYSPKLSSFVEALKKRGINEIIAELNQTFVMKNMQLMIFNGETVTQYGNARILRASDYPLYEAFFKESKPAADPNGWLYEYFIEKAAKEYFAGYIKDGKLVSVCDAPDMPCMEGQIQHTGVETLSSERRKGYAKSVAALAAHCLIEKGVCPQWECGIDNTASVKLAEAVGYEKYGTAYILEE